MSEEALEGARDTVPRVQGGSQVLSVRISSTHYPGALWQRHGHSGGWSVSQKLALQGSWLDGGRVIWFL